MRPAFGSLLCGLHIGACVVGLAGQIRFGGVIDDGLEPDLLISGREELSEVPA